MKTLLLKSLVVVQACVTLASEASAVGRFEGKIITEWLEDGGHRYMKTFQPFAYIDSRGRRWNVPAGSKADGASIPKIFWSIIGGPFEGPYRDASVVHDYYCDKRSRKWEEVHEVFYDAMLTRGIAQTKAWLMYKAVVEFGPRWDAPKIDPKCLKPDGKFNFGKCTENASISPAPKREAEKITRDKLLDFLKEVEGKASPQDIERLKREVDRL